MTSMVTVTRREHFSAAHVLSDPTLTEKENRERFGACVNVHGHNYILEVSVAGDIDVHGYVCDLRALGQVMRDRIIGDVDHKHLNHDVPWLAGQIPSTEVLVVAIWDRLVGHIPQGRLACVRLFETEKNVAEYRG